MSKKPDVYYGLPEDVVFCTRCVMSNQRPASYPEFKNTVERQIPTMHIDDEGICDACRFAESKENIDWKEREFELTQLLDKHRRSDGHYDCIVPGSGGKDSVYAAHVLKYKYGMNPLTVTWQPIMYTDIGLKNFRKWIENGGFDNITFKPNGVVQRELTRLSIENLFHPFQTFILGQKSIAAKFSIRYNVPLVFYGENEAEYGNPIADNTSAMRDRSFHTYQNLDNLHLAGVPVQKLLKDYDWRMSDLAAYLPPVEEELDRSETEVHYLGYYLKWVPQEAYYYSAEHIDFEANPERTEGTYSKYNSIDDMTDGFHYYTTYIKFGLGRATYDASQEVRNGHISREEAVALVDRFDGEFPERYFQQFMDHIGMKPERFMELVDEHRSPHLWKQENGEWKLRHPVSRTSNALLGTGTAGDR